MFKNVIFGNRIGILFEESDENQVSIGKTLGISKQTLTGYKSGQTPTVENLMRIADYFDVSTDYLLGRTDKRDINR